MVSASSHPRVALRALLFVTSLGLLLAGSAVAQTGLSNANLSLEATWDPSQPPPVTVHFEWVGAPQVTVDWDFGDGKPGSKVSGPPQMTYVFEDGGIFDVRVSHSKAVGTLTVDIHNEVLIDDFEDTVYSMDLWTPRDGTLDRFPSLFSTTAYGGEARLVLSQKIEDTGGSAGKPNVIYTGGDDGEGDGGGDGDGDGGFSFAPADRAFYFGIDLRLSRVKPGTYGSISDFVTFEGGSTPLTLQAYYKSGALRLRLAQNGQATSWIAISDLEKYRALVSYQPGVGSQLMVLSTESPSPTTFVNLLVAGETAAAAGIQVGLTTATEMRNPYIDVYIDNVALYRYGDPLD